MFFMLMLWHTANKIGMYGLLHILTYLFILNIYYFLWYLPFDWLLQVNYTNEPGGYFFKITLMYTSSEAIISSMFEAVLGCTFYQVSFKVFLYPSIWPWTSIDCLKHIQSFRFYFILCGSLRQSINQSSCNYNMSSSRPCLRWKLQLCEGRHRRGSWIEYPFRHLSYKTCKNVGKECKVK